MFSSPITMSLTMDVYRIVIGGRRRDGIGTPPPPPLLLNSRIILDFIHPDMMNLTIIYI